MSALEIPYLREIDQKLIEKDEFTGLGCIALISNPEDKLLVHLRDDKDWIAHPSLWAFIGGVVEVGEDPRSAILREVKEEVNLSATNANPIYKLVDVEGSGNLITVFEIFTSSLLSELTLNEGQDFGFFSPLEILQKPLVPFAKDLINIHFVHERR